MTSKPSPRSRPRGRPVALACVALLVAGLAPAAPPPPVRAPTSTPEAPEDPAPPKELPEGAVLYRTLTGREAQVTFTSEAPLERIVGKSNAVRGYAVSGAAAAPAALAGATWVLPVTSLATGLPLRDEHLAGRDWLDAETHPEIRFELARVADVREIKRGDGFSTWSATLIGTMTLHGESHELRVPDARLSFLDASEKTRTIAPGNLLFIRCDYEVKLSDFGVRNADVPGKVSDTVELTQMLRLSSASPAEIRASDAASTPPG